MHEGTGFRAGPLSPYQEKEMMKTNNLKFEITDIAHEKYPFLHRIRALRNIGGRVKAGDLGGFVEAERNLSQKDTSWIFDDAIAAGDAFVDQDARLFGKAVACDSAYVSQGASMSAEARAEDHAYIRGAGLCGHARASGHSIILHSPDTGRAPILSETCAVYGTVISGYDHGEEMGHMLWHLRGCGRESPANGLASKTKQKQKGNVHER